MYFNDYYYTCFSFSEYLGVDKLETEHADTKPGTSKTIGRVAEREAESNWPFDDIASKVQRAFVNKANSKKQGPKTTS